MEVLDGEDGAVMEELSGPDLGAALRHGLFGDQGTTLLPSRSALVFVDAAVPPPGPRSLKHRISTSQSLVAAEATELGGLPVEPPREVPPEVTFVAAAVAVDLSPAAALASPLRGKNWLIFRGCCDLATSHRGTATAYDGRLFIAERFAIDFAQADDDGRLIAGPGNELSSYASYGEPVYAVADGTVVSAHDGEPDQVPGALPTGMSAETAGGNAVVLDIGEGRFAFYAHLKPGSVSVAVGDRVTSGDQIGQTRQLRQILCPAPPFSRHGRRIPAGSRWLALCVHEVLRAGCARRRWPREGAARAERTARSKQPRRRSTGRSSVERPSCRLRVRCLSAVAKMDRPDQVAARYCSPFKPSRLAGSYTRTLSHPRRAGPGCAPLASQSRRPSCVVRTLVTGRA